jgi:hypothetical protein
MIARTCSAESTQTTVPRCIRATDITVLGRPGPSPIKAAKKTSVILAVSPLLLPSSSETDGSSPDSRARKLHPNGPVMTAFVVAVFLLVCLGMILGGLSVLKHSTAWASHSSEPSSWWRRGL